VEFDEAWAREGDKVAPDPAEAAAEPAETVAVAGSKSEAAA